jgi:nitrate reductase alpha subunit
MEAAWAHYVGQEKVRPIMGFQHMAFALDWHRPPRHMNQTAYWYVNASSVPLRHLHRRRS